MTKQALSMLCAVFLAFQLQGAAPSLNSAKVTQVQNSVLLQEGQAPVERPAVVGDMVQGTRTLVTGKKSRAELLFNDNTIARLGSNSVFSFKPGTRDIELKSGFLLLHTPKGHGGAKIKTPTAAASVLGTTIMLSALPDGGQKLVVLEGTASITFNGVTQTVSAGQLVFLTPGGGMSPPINIDLAKLVSSSGLMNGLGGSIGSENLINEAIQGQTEQIADGELENSGFTIGGDDSGLNVVNDSSALQQALEDLTDLNLPPDSPAPPAEENLAGVFNINSNSLLDYSNPEYEGLPTLTTGDQTIIGTFGAPEGYDLGGGEGDVFFFGTFVNDELHNRFRFAQGPPQEVNGSEISGLNFLAFGDESNDTLGLASIIFNDFNDAESEGGADINSLNFYAFNSGITLSNSVMEFEGHLGLLAFGSEGVPGNITIQDTSLGSTEGGLRDLYVGTFGGDVEVNNSTLTTSQLFESYGEGQIGEIGGGEQEAGMFVEVFGGKTTASNSTLQHLVQVIGEYGEGYFEDLGGVNLITFDGRTEINHSQILTRSDIGPSAVFIGSPDMGGNSFVLIDQSTISSAIGASAGAIDIIGNQVSINNSTISAVTAGGASAPVSVMANVIDLTAATLRGSTVSLGNDSQTAMINFIGNNNFIWTDTGVDGFFRNGTQTGNVQVGVNGQGPESLVEVTPETPVGGGGGT